MGEGQVSLCHFVLLTSNSSARARKGIHAEEVGLLCFLFRLAKDSSARAAERLRKRKAKGGGVLLVFCLLGSRVERSNPPALKGSECEKCN